MSKLSLVICAGILVVTTSLGASLVLDAVSLEGSARMLGSFVYGLFNGALIGCLLNRALVSKK